jgi:hypothetical protein
VDCPALADEQLLREMCLKTNLSLKNQQFVLLFSIWRLDVL